MMSDQANVLRGLMQQRRDARQQPTADRARPGASSIVFSSGKGGVGKSILALNTAVALQQAGSRVCLIDANPGTGNIDLLAGLSGYWNLSHVLTGARQIGDVLIPGPTGVQIINGAAPLLDLHGGPAVPALLDDLRQLEAEFDVFVIDAPSTAVCASRSALYTAAHHALLVTSPEPTSIADTYAVIKSLGSRAGQILVNMAESAEQAFHIIDRLQQTSRMFLHFEPSAAGFVPFDPHVMRAVIRRHPLLLESPHASASASIVGLAQRIRDGVLSLPPAESFADRLQAALEGTPSTSPRPTPVEAA